jgi:hypothetical protein
MDLLSRKAQQAIADTRGVALLSLQGGARDVRGHGVAGHLSPRVVRRRGLRVPYVAGVPTEVSLFEGLDERVGLDDRPASDIDEVGATLHVGESLPVE